MSEDKKIEIVSGDENDLDISPVHDHISPIKPQNTDDKKPKNIVIPKKPQNTDDKKPKNIVIPKEKKDREEEN